MPRRGFGRAEVIVVLCLLAALAAVLAPAVQKVRLAAALSTCQCRHCQIGLALNSYAATNNDLLPAGTIPQPMPAEERLSWIVETLPYMEGDAIARQLDRTAGHADPANAAATNTPLRWAVCPTARTDQPITHSVGVAGVGADAADLPLGHPRAGAFGTDRRTPFPGGFRDGTSNTLLVIETGSSPGRWAAGGTATVRGLDPTDRPLAGPGRPFADFHPDGTLNPFSARRYKLVAAMADGHTRVLSSDVDPAVLAALVTVAGGESLPPD